MVSSASDIRRRSSRRRGCGARPSGDDARISVAVGGRPSRRPAPRRWRAASRESSPSSWRAMPDASISWTLAQVCGAFHQLWNLIDSSGAPPSAPARAPPTGMLPPWPLTIRMRRKPERCTEAIISRATASSVSTLQRDRARESQEIGREPEGHHRKDRYAKRLRRLDCDALGQDGVDAERELRMLLRRADRQDAAVVGGEIGLDLHPVHVGDTHGLYRNSRRETATYRQAPARQRSRMKKALPDCREGCFEVVRARHQRGP